MTSHVVKADLHMTDHRIVPGEPPEAVKDPIRRILDCAICTE
jgi:hypothetical protein